MEDRKISKVRFKIDPERLEVNDLIAVEGWANRSDSGDNRLMLKEVRPMRDFLAGMLMDEDGNFIDREEAVKIVGTMKISELNEAVQKFMAEYKRLQDEALPPTDAAS